MKVVCGRIDCEYLSRGICQLGIIGIGLDGRCQNYIRTCNEDKLERFRRSVEQISQEKIENEKETCV